MTIKQEIVFIKDDNRSTGGLLSKHYEDVLRLLKKHEVKFHDICPIMGLQRYCEVTGVKLQPYQDMPFSYAVINFEDKKKYIVMNPHGNKSQYILIDISVGAFKRMFSTPKTVVFKYYNKQVKLRSYLNKADYIDVEVTSNGKKQEVANFYVTEELTQVSDVKLLKAMFINKIKYLKKQQPLLYSALGLAPKKK